MTTRIFISAGEPSGDLHASHVARALKDRFPDLVLEAFGGPHLADAGAIIRYPMAQYTVMGFAEIVTKIPAHFRLLRAVERRFRAGEFDLAILVDYPGFHLRLAESAHRAGVKVLYYIAPQLWAWRPERARRFAPVVDRLAVILPFEERFFATVGMRAEYVGHPLVDRGPVPERRTARAELGLAPNGRVLALFPGSRHQEIERLWPAFRDAALTLLAEGACQTVVVAGTADGRYDDPGPIRIHRGDPRAVFAAANAAMAKSGTTTLEAALADTPMVVAYRVHPVTSWVARRLMTVKWISLVNLIADAPVVDELVQGDVNLARLVEAVRPLLDPEDPKTIAQRAGLERVRELVGGPGAAERVAAIAAEMLG